MDILKSLFWLSGMSILTCWGIYPAIITVLSGMTRMRGIREKRNGIGGSVDLSFSVIISAYNEERRIGRRIKNLLEMRCKKALEIIVGSDGATDKTVRVVKQLGDPRVKVFAFEKNRGRALVHNDCAREASGDILLFTDAETIFEADFIDVIGAHFDDGEVGAVSGRMIYLNQNDSSIGRSAGFYWRYEEMIRRSESELGILGFGTGACLAIRKEAYRPIGPSEDIDYAETLELVGDGYRVVYEPKAIAYDFISETARGAFKTRVRQTSRSFKSILRRTFSMKIVARPGVFLAALFHKTFRHLTPFFMLFLLVSSFGLFGSKPVYTIIFLAQIVLYSLALIGWKYHAPRRYTFLFTVPFNFVILNLGRGVGVLAALLGKEKSSYQTVR
jgi:biofilm PGA synthesis N-glycosyltransferase PgaC